FRYANPFRYDTERVVFGKLEELRGTKRKKDALDLAVASLEDHASDLHRRNEAISEKAAARRDRQLSILLGGTGVFGAGQMIYWIGETAKGGDGKPAKAVALDFFGLPSVKLGGAAIMDVTVAVMGYAVICFVPFFFYIVGSVILNWARETRWRRKVGDHL